MSMKNSNDNIGNRTRDLPVCRAVHHKGVTGGYPNGEPSGLYLPLQN